MIARTERKPRIAIVGARRVRQGLGGFMACQLAALGAEVVAVLGSSPESAARAVADLGAHHDLQVRGYARLQELLAVETIDALVIASPHETHLEYLAAALAAGKHVLCEKPLVWGTASPAVAPEVVMRVEELELQFRDRGLLLWENVQWPYTLDSFLELYPGAYSAAQPVTRFSMLLCPSSSGPQMLVDSFSHVASMLCALDAPRAPVLEAIKYRKGPEPVHMLDLEAVYPGTRANIVVTCRLLRVDAPPRPASYAINGHAAYRRIEEPGYRMNLADTAEGAGRSVPLADPMTALLRDFVASLTRVLAGRPVVVDPWISARLELLQQVVEMYPRE
ncbi:MAG: Gfo/Idh/MocA family protein [Planctomycetota bacterium]